MSFENDEELRKRLEMIGHAPEDTTPSGATVGKVLGGIAGAGAALYTGQPELVGAGIQAGGAIGGVADGQAPTNLSGVSKLYDSLKSKKIVDSETGEEYL